jgi:alkylation response protein AidB-like acyl-CoA dehydrogenase
MNFELTQEQRAFQTRARDFARERMMPFARAWDEDAIFPVETLRPAIIFEELVQGCTSTAAYLSIHMAAWMIDVVGSAAQRQEFLPKLCCMQHFASYCLTEPGSGSDAASLSTRAERKGDTYSSMDPRPLCRGAASRISTSERSHASDH